MTELVKALNKHVTTPNWNKDVAAKLDKMVEEVREDKTRIKRPFDRSSILGFAILL